MHWHLMCRSVNSTKSISKIQNLMLYLNINCSFSNWKFHFEIANWLRMTFKLKALTTVDYLFQYITIFFCLFSFRRYHQKQKCRNNVYHKNILAVIIACFHNIYSTLRYLQEVLHRYLHQYIIVLIILSRSII